MKKNSIIFIIKETEHQNLHRLETSRLTGGLNDTVLVRFGSIAMTRPISESLNHFFGFLKLWVLFSLLCFWGRRDRQSGDQRVLNWRKECINMDYFG